MPPTSPPHPTRGPAVRSVARVLPPHYADQDTLIAAFRAQWAEKHFNLNRLEELHRAVQVRGRHLSLPVSAYAALDTFSKQNDAWIRTATDLGEQAVREALERGGISPGDVNHLYFVTVTGLATPSIDARLANRLGLRPDVKRTPVFGLGCVGGAAGLARASDVLRAFPSDVAVLLSVELCSLTLQRADLSIANVIASGIFGDGAAAVVLEGAGRSGASPRILSTRSVFYRETEWVMGWDMVDAGFKVVLSAKVPEIVRSHIGRDVDQFLAAQELDRSRVRHWLVLSGGPMVLEAFVDALELPANALERSWRSLREIGNLSSASVLFVLGDLLDSGEAQPGDLGLLVAMGPGFCSELVLLEW
jgi:alkylresorcinol/alkylpyrone synthase